MLGSFNLKEYNFYEKVENGDLNWVVPNKLLAFSTPNDSALRGGRCFSVDKYIPILHKFSVKAVVRLNDRLYDESKLQRNGIAHRDIFFEDGSCPHEEHIESFLDLVEKTPGKMGAVAVHCKAGLGRTGTLIGLYIMKHYKFPAPALIGWMRLCRPGMVLGPQQQFLCDMQDEMFLAGEDARISKNIPKELYLKMRRVGQETRGKLGFIQDSSKFYYRKEDNQGDRLVNLKYEQHRQPRKSTTHTQTGSEWRDSTFRSSSAMRAKSSNEKARIRK